MHALGFSIEVKKDDKHLMLYGKESKTKTWLMLRGARAIGAWIVALTIYFSESNIEKEKRKDR